MTKNKFKIIPIIMVIILAFLVPFVRAENKVAVNGEESIMQFLKKVLQMKMKKQLLKEILQMKIQKQIPKKALQMKANKQLMKMHHSKKEMFI